MTHHKVVIIGAGITGCAAAKTLMEDGVLDVVVLEGTDRVGGRVKTIPHGQGMYTHGGSLYNALDSNTWYTVDKSPEDIILSDLSHYLYHIAMVNHLL